MVAQGKSGQTCAYRSTARRRSRRARDRAVTRLLIERLLREDGSSSTGRAVVITSCAPAKLLRLMTGRATSGKLKNVRTRCIAERRRVGPGICRPKLGTACHALPPERDAVAGGWIW